MKLITVLRVCAGIFVLLFFVMDIASAGSSWKLQVIPDWGYECDQDDANLGTSVASAGDVNGDGYDDVIIGAPNFDPGGLPYAGQAYVYLGSGSGLANTSAWTKISEQSGAYLGTNVAGAGDVNGDGYDDIIIGAPYWSDEPGQKEGLALVYNGSAGGLSANADWEAVGEQAESRFGMSVAGRCDVNGDGYSDVIVGAPESAGQQTDEGRVFAFYGSAGGLSLSADWFFTSNQTGAYLGGSVACVGDVNNDGYDDVIIGASNYYGGEPNEGRAYLFLGSAGGLQSDPDWVVGSAQADAHLGNSVAGAGDVNGDGFADVLVGAFQYDKGETDEGAVWAFYGEPSDDDDDDTDDDTTGDDSDDDDADDDDAADDDTADDSTDDDVHASDGDDDNSGGCCGC